MIKSFELGPYTWNVKKYKKLSDNKLGNCDPIKCLIELANTYKDSTNKTINVSKDIKEHTFYHELTHSILMMLSHPLAYDEQFVDSFSLLLYQFEKTKKE